MFLVEGERMISHTSKDIFNSELQYVCSAIQLFELSMSPRQDRSESGSPLPNECDLTREPNYRNCGVIGVFLGP